MNQALHNVTDGNELDAVKDLGSILLVEDNQIMQVVEKKMLEKMGRKVYLAENGLLALKILKEDEETQNYNIQIVFMDVQMPEMNGLEATKEIRQHLKIKKNIPIVAMTASDDEASREESLSSGMTDFASKPIKMEQIKEILYKYLDELKPNEIKLKSLFDGDEEIFLSLSKTFISQIPSYQEGLLSALKKEDFSEGERLAHSLKGLGKTFASPALSLCAEQLERKFKEKKIKECEVFVLKLNTYLTELGSYLNGFVRG